MRSSTINKIKEITLGDGTCCDGTKVIEASPYRKPLNEDLIITIFNIPLLEGTLEQCWRSCLVNMILV